MKLISMTDFVLEKNYNGKYLKNDLKSIVKYANFLKLPLQLGFFVPCDEDGNVLEHPKEVDCVMALNKCENSINKIEQYQQAKERVIFKGFVVERGNTKFNSKTLYITNSDGFDIASKTEGFDLNFIWDVGYKTIEDLIPYNITITENAIKTYNL